MEFYELRLKPGAIATLIRIKFSGDKGPLRENPSRRLHVVATTRSKFNFKIGEERFYELLQAKSDRRSPKRLPEKGLKSQ
jgi:hypothetical protein